MIPVSTLPNICYPIDYTVDKQKLKDSIDILLSRLGIVYNDEPDFSINLTHLPGLSGSDRWLKYSDKHPTLEAAGINEYDFTVLLTEARDLYVGHVIQEIQTIGNCRGRVTLVWMGANNSLPLHKDGHVTKRYHIPLITNADCYWIFHRTPLNFKIHMPADERVWSVDTDYIHTFRNDSNSYRLHMIVTDYKNKPYWTNW